MSFVLKVDGHKCCPPDVHYSSGMYQGKTLGVGTIWRCDECGKHKVLHYKSRILYDWDNISKFMVYWKTRKVGKIMIEDKEIAGV